MTSGQHPARTHPREYQKREKKPAFANVYANTSIVGNMLDINHDVNYLMLSYMKIMLKTLKKTANAHTEVRAALRKTLNLFCLKMVSRWLKMVPRWSRWPQDGQDGPRWPKMARRWPKMASSWPQVGSTWVIRRSWRWLSVDDVVQK